MNKLKESFVAFKHSSSILIFLLAINFEVLANKCECNKHTYNYISSLFFESYEKAMDVTERVALYQETAESRNKKLLTLNLPYPEKAGLQHDLKHHTTLITQSTSLTDLLVALSMKFEAAWNSLTFFNCRRVLAPKDIGLEHPCRTIAKYLLNFAVFGLDRLTSRIQYFLNRPIMEWKENNTHGNLNDIFENLNKVVQKIVKFGEESDNFEEYESEGRRAIYVPTSVSDHYQHRYSKQVKSMTAELETIRYFFFKIKLSICDGKPGDPLQYFEGKYINIINLWQEKHRLLSLLKTCKSEKSHSKRLIRFLRKKPTDTEIEGMFHSCTLRILYAIWAEKLKVMDRTKLDEDSEQGEEDNSNEILYPQEKIFQIFLTKVSMEGNWRIKIARFENNICHTTETARKFSKSLKNIEKLDELSSTII